MKKIGYHYTSWENWQQIKERGLIPSFINKPEFLANGISVTGIWIWPKDQKGENHLGSLIWQLYTKAALKVVKLQVLYDLKDQWKTDHGGKLTVTHSGTVGKFVYHKGLKSVIIAKPIPAESIKLVKVYDLIKLLT